jgi:hypothetical protein
MNPFDRHIGCDNRAIGSSNNSRVVANTYFEIRITACENLRQQRYYFAFRKCHAVILLPSRYPLEN